MPQLEIEPLTGHSFPELHVGTLRSSAHVGVIRLSRPDRANALGGNFWTYFKQAVQVLENWEDVRAVLIVGEGPHFCSGIDKAYLASLFAAASKYKCQARMREHFRTHLMGMQDAFTILERCKWPVIAAVHGGCIGGGVDLITACDIRVASRDATFCVKAVDLAITEDLGTLQRLPAIIGYGPAVDLSMTARTIDSQEALRLGLITQILGSERDELHAAAARLAQAVAAKPPIAIIGTKRVLQHTRDAGDSVSAGLEYVATYNAAMIFSDDVGLAMKTGKSGPPPRYSKL